MMRPSAISVAFSPFKYGQLLAVDSSNISSWTGIVPDGEPHVLDFHEFLVVSRGKARIDLNGDGFLVQGPAVFFTPPRAVRRVELIDSMQLDLVVCSDKALRSGGWIAALQSMRAGAVDMTAPEVWPAVTGVAQQMQVELRGPRPDSGLLLDALLTQFLVALNRSRQAAGRTWSPPLVQEFESLLERSFRHHHDVRYYAAMLSVTADYLSSIARRHRGVPAKAMIDRRIFGEAARLLTQTARPVSAISSSLGFEEPCHLTRFFIRMNGGTPSEYRAAVNRSRNSTSWSGY